MWTLLVLSNNSSIETLSTVMNVLKLFIVANHLCQPVLRTDVSESQLLSFCLLFEVLADDHSIRTAKRRTKIQKLTFYLASSFQVEMHQWINGCC